MDVKSEVEKAVAQITGDEKKVAAFKKDPTGTVKSVLGSGAGKDLIEKVVAAVKSALGSGGIGGIAKKAGDAIGGLFGKKKD